MTTTTILPGDDAVELGELLGFLHDWLSTNTDAALSLRHFTLGLIGLDELRSDLARFASVLGVEVPTNGDGDRDEDGDDT
jgi:hypothetical protein